MSKTSRIYININIFFKLLIFLIKVIFYKKENKKINNKFKNKIRKFVNASYILDFSFCRSAFFHSLISLKSDDKKEVIISPYALYPMINMIIYAGCKPVFVDFNENNIELSLKNIKKKINKNTLAVLITNYTETNSNIRQIYNHLKKKNIFLIEDCAIQFKYNPLFNSDIKLFSFNLTKNINSIHGGFLATNSKKIKSLLDKDYKNYEEIPKNFLIKKTFEAIILKSITSKIIYNLIFFNIVKHCYIRGIDIFFKFYRPDHNPKLERTIPFYLVKRMNSLQKEIILKQLHSSSKNFKIRFEKVKIYFKELKNLPILRVPYKNIYNPNYLDFMILCKTKNIKDKLFKYLLLRGYETRYYTYRDCSTLKIYKKFNKKQKYENSKKIADTVLLLPCHSNYSNYQIRKISRLIKDFSNSKFN
jgi:perosamine synthetase